MKSPRVFLKNILNEMRYVVWPKRNDVFLTLLLVVIVGIILSVILLLMDRIVLFFLGRFFVQGAGNG